MNYETDTKKGRYVIQNPAKYIGASDPIYKSKWEQNVFAFMDFNENVIKWGYECKEIPYVNPVKTTSSKPFTVYYPDIFCLVKQTNGKEQGYMIEIKPAKMCIPPKPPTEPKNKTPLSMQRYQKLSVSYQYNLVRYLENDAKWSACRAWCDRHGVIFQLLNEKNCQSIQDSNI